MKKHPDCVDECLVAAARGPLRICTDKCAYAEEVKHDEIHESPADNPRVLPINGLTSEGYHFDEIAIDKTKAQP